MKVIGLTGGIASGKSTAAQYFRKMGAPVIDVDAVAHRLMAPGGDNYDRIVSGFGREVLAADGTIDRRRLGARVFSDPKERRRLEELTHPAIRRAVEEQVESFRQSPGEGCVFLDHPLLLEMGMEGLVDEVWVVACPPEAQRQRLAERDRLTPQAVEERLAAQMPTEQKTAKADRVLWNGGTYEDFLAQLDKVWKERLLCSPESH